ncbi:hypothetical protein REPUB_Repub18cG0133000 [Reevesia pubescens]
MARTLESKLYEAAEEGSVTTFLELIQQDRLPLDRVLVNYTTENHLHVAAMLGHTDFVKEIIHRKPDFTRESDSRGSSALHLASAKGYVEIVKALLFVNPDMCLARDIEERNPLHLAAMKGQVDVLKELVQARSQLQAAQVTVAWGETILHLCVKYGQFESLKLLIEVMDDHGIVNAKDDYGMTILHLAVADKQIEEFRFLSALLLLVEVNGLNANGFTALDVLAQSRRGLKDFDIAESLRDAGALRVTDTSHPGHRIGGLRTNATPLIAQNFPTNAPARQYHKVQKTIKKEDWLTRKRDALMVVASLIATMAFQAGLTPPGGLWQEDFAGTSQGNNGKESHEAGTSIIADRNQSNYTLYLSFNTTSFVASLNIILLLISGLPFKRRVYMWNLTVMVWIAITSMALTYRISLLVFTPKTQQLNVTRVLDYAILVWSGVMGLLLGHTTRLTTSLFKKVENLLGKKRKQPPPLVYPPLAQTNISDF